MRPVSLLIKPASGRCNMRCSYCFYRDETSHRVRCDLGFMSRETAEKLVEKAFRAAGGRGEVHFSFQGGEPTLAGLDFFRDFAALADERNRDRIPVHWALQTNGLLLDEAWADFLTSRRFLVGVSVDGDRSLHDRRRRDANGQGTFDRTIERIRMLLDAGADVNLLCVVTGQAAEKPKQVYRAMKSLGVRYLQFIPCLDPLEKPRGSMPWSLTPEAYARFLCGVFDLWYRDWEKGDYVSVRQFDDWVHLAAGQPAGSCASCGDCGGYLVAEADGSLYPCDFYALDAWQLGTADQELTDLLKAETMEAFRARSRRKPAPCLVCPWFFLCRGGCPNDWDTEKGGNYYCSAFQTFFNYAARRILRIAEMERILG